MPKKEKIWNGGMPKGPTGPWAWSVWVKGSRKPIRVVAFDLQHIKDQLEGKTFVKAKQVPEEKEDRRPMHLGPKGCVVNQPANYDAGFRILRAWIDSVGGPPEEIRKQLRELWIDYDRVDRKKKK